MLLQHLLNGVTIGCSYALIALGYTLVYGVLKLINFAHGEVYMIGAYLGYILVSIIPSVPLFQSHLIVVLLTVMALAAMLCAYTASTWRRSATAHCARRRSFPP